MKKVSFYKKIKDGENKKTFLLGMLLSYKKKTAMGYVDRRLFGLWKAKKKNHVIRYYLAGLYVWKKSTEKSDELKVLKNEINSQSDELKVLKNEINSQKEKLISLRNNMERNVNSFNSSLINLLLVNGNDNNLFYIRTLNKIFVFSKKVFQYNACFIRDYMYIPEPNAFYTLGFLPEGSPLYKENIEGFKKENVLLCKYFKKVGIIQKSMISCSSEKKELFKEITFLGIENYHHPYINFQNLPKEKIVCGYTVENYIRGKSEDEKRKILKVFFDWLFSTYSAENDETKLKGIIADSHLSNFIVTDEGFLFIDQDVVSKRDFSKDDCLWYALMRIKHDENLYEYFRELYGLKKVDSLSTFHPFFEKNLKKSYMAEAAVLNKNLLDKYFTDKCLMPEFD